MRKLFGFLACFFWIFGTVGAQVHTTYLWHMDQPVYWAEKSAADPTKKQFVKESHDLKMAGKNKYPGSSVSHPTNDLQEIFSKADRVNAYQAVPRNAVNSIKGLNGEAGAQLSISGGLMDNLRSLGSAGQWGYSSSWNAPYKEAAGWKTAGGFARLDIVGFSYDHALSPLVSARVLKKQIQAHQYSAKKYYGHVSKGYWPAECAFSERVIQTLVECGIEWSVIPNSHLARTLDDYVHPFNINGNIDAPNKADKVSTKGLNWFDGAIDGRGSRLAAPYCYQVHKAQYIDPYTGQAYQIDVVPMCNYISYIDGYSGANVSDVSSKIAPFGVADKPCLLLLAHDGDNAWGGGSSYYNEAVPGFSSAAKKAGYVPTTIQQFLSDHPTASSDVVKVEDGAWVNADNDWGHPQYINWLWPLYHRSDQTFDPDGWTEDARNWAVITATDNYVTMAEDLEGGHLRIEKITDGGSQATDAELSWHFFFGGLNSGFMYYGKAEDMEVKPSMTGNIAIEHAQKVIAQHPNVDKTPPSVFIPQRYPYNPGGVTFGPTSGYKKIDNPEDFTVWTFAYDVNGLQSVRLIYRLDKDGVNPLSDSDNDTYAGGAGVEGWMSVDMTIRDMAVDPVDPELNFFILPKAKAKLCYGQIKGSSYTEKLIDYYVEATDNKGNVFHSPIQHVYVEKGTGSGSGSDPGSGPRKDRFFIDYGVEGTPWLRAEFIRHVSDSNLFELTIDRPTDQKTQYWIGYNAEGGLPAWDNSRNRTVSFFEMPHISDCSDNQVSIRVRSTNKGINWDPEGFCGTLTSVQELSADPLVVYGDSYGWHLLLPDPYARYDVKVVSLEGRLIVRSQAVGTALIESNDWDRGIYLIDVTDLSTGRSYRQKVVQ